MSWMGWLGILAWLVALFGVVVWAAWPRELKH